MIHRLIRAALVAILAVTSLGVAASPAMADTVCPSTGYICLWTSADYTGQKIATNVRVCQNMVGAQDNAITSLKVSPNTASNDWRVYLGYNCSGTALAVGNGTKIPTLVGTIYDNDISSIGP